MDKEECDEDCMLCSGEACNKCGAGSWNLDAEFCEHDVIERHEEPERELSVEPCKFCESLPPVCDGKSCFRAKRAAKLLKELEEEKKNCKTCKAISYTTGDEIYPITEPCFRHDPVSHRKWHDIDRFWESMDMPTIAYGILCSEGSSIYPVIITDRKDVADQILEYLKKHDPDDNPGEIPDLFVTDPCIVPIVYMEGVAWNSYDNPTIGPKGEKLEFEKIEEKPKRKESFMKQLALMTGIPKMDITDLNYWFRNIHHCYGLNEICRICSHKIDPNEANFGHDENCDLVLNLNKKI